MNVAIAAQRSIHGARRLGLLRTMPTATAIALTSPINAQTIALVGGSAKNAMDRRAMQTAYEVSSLRADTLVSFGQTALLPVTGPRAGPVRPWPAQSRSVSAFHQSVGVPV